MAEYCLDEFVFSTNAPLEEKKMSEAPRYEAITTPAGLAIFPWITKADTKHVPTGVFKVDVSIPEELATDTINKLERIRDEFIATLSEAKQGALTPRPVYLTEYTRPEYPEDATDEEKEDIRLTFEGQPTGNILLRWKMKARVMPREGEMFDQAPVVVDAATGEAITAPVYDGSIIRVKGQVVPYTNAKDAVVGVTLRMKSVQVIELVSGSGEGSSFWTDFEAE